MAASNNDVWRDVTRSADDEGLNLGAVKSEIRSCLINAKANACPMGIRLAWHASGTYDKKDGSGGSDGATMRFEPEISDDANAGLPIIHDMLRPVKLKYPKLSYADLWACAGACAVEFLGGPAIPFQFGRKDEPNGSTCPAHGRLPDGALGADHLRDVFYRMGFNDQEIVALSGAHTLGRCHVQRSGFDGPWTRQPLKFDNTYFRNILNLSWQEKKWNGPTQYEDVETQSLMMLPTDIALRDDPSFRQHVERYAKNEQVFFKEFADAFSKLLALGTKAQQPKTQSPEEKASADFRDYAMHGSLIMCKRLVDSGLVDVHAVDPFSGRSGLHYASFWGHEEIIDWLLNDLKLDPDCQDRNGDTPMHDAAHFGHTKIIKLLREHKANEKIKNKKGLTAEEVAHANEKDVTAIGFKSNL